MFLFCTETFLETFSLAVVYAVDLKTTTGLKVCVNLNFKLILKQLGCLK